MALFLEDGVRSTATVHLVAASVAHQHLVAGHSFFKLLHFSVKYGELVALVSTSFFFDFFEVIIIEDVRISNCFLAFGVLHVLVAHLVEILVFLPVYVVVYLTRAAVAPVRELSWVHFLSRVSFERLRLPSLSKIT